MARYTGPKDKLSRREGMNIFESSSRSLQRRLSTPPGMHPRKRRKRESEYATQLREKQKVKRIYGVLEKQFRRYFAIATARPGATGEILLQLLERRLDNVVYRLGWARTRPQARQLVTHGHVLVNDRTVNIPSYSVSPGEVIRLSEKASQIPDVLELRQDKGLIIPDWLERQGPVGRVKTLPSRENVGPDIAEELIVEFYSR